LLFRLAGFVILVEDITVGIRNFCPYPKPLIASLEIFDGSKRTLIREPSAFGSLARMN